MSSEFFARLEYRIQYITHGILNRGAGTYIVIDSNPALTTNKYFRDRAIFSIFDVGWKPNGGVEPWSETVSSTTVPLLQGSGQIQHLEGEWIRWPAPWVPHTMTGSNQTWN